MGLNDTIAELLRRQAARQGLPPAEPDVGRDWSTDADAVMDAIRQTLAPYVEAGTASVTSDLMDVSEELIGTYSIQRLAIDVAGSRILVEPIARYTFGGTGRIDMYRETRPSEDDRLLILRPSDLPTGARAPWLIETRRMLSFRDFMAAGGVERGARRYVPFDPDGIEAALDHLLTMA